MNNIILIGFMGTGKTTVGRRLAVRLGLDFYDTDEYVKKCEKMSVFEIVTKKGKKYFEGAERFAVINLAEKENCVISTGGSTVWDEENYKVLKNSGVLIWLSGNTETVYENTVNSHNKRSLLSGLGMAEIRELVKKSEKYYEKADFKVEVDNIEVDEICERIIDFLKINTISK